MDSNLTASPEIAHEFVPWLANHLNQERREVEVLLGDTTAVRFLMTWSIFEQTCGPDKYIRGHTIPKMAQQMVKHPRFKRANFADYLEHFHARYQDPEKYRNLKHKDDKAQEVDGILEKPTSALSNYETVRFLIYVVFRYRNNMFHGVKGIASWLRFRPQINRCSNIMQSFIDLAKEEPN